MSLYIVAAVLVVMMIILLIGLDRVDHDHPVYNVLQWIPVVLVIGSIIFFAICVMSVR